MRFVALFAAIVASSFCPTRAAFQLAPSSLSRRSSIHATRKEKHGGGRHASVQRPSWITLASGTVSDDDDDDDDDDEEIAPNNMRVAEIKAELDLREVSYADCFDKESLVERLEGARATGKANPKILEKFNKQKLEETFAEKKTEVTDEDINRAVAGDGRLPGGLTPDRYRKLTSNPEIMTLLQSTKMQEAMSLMMTGGQDELEGKLRDDPELKETLEKLSEIMADL
jgi:hypothetical protein